MNMNGYNMNHNDLDTRIRAALRVEPSRQQLDRLEEFWRQHSFAARRRRRIRFAAGSMAAVAVTIFLVVTISVYYRTNEPARCPVEIERQTLADSREPDTNSTDASKDVLAAQSPPKEKSLSAGRPPTAYELLFFVAKTGVPVATNRSPKIANKDVTPDRLARDPQLDVEQLVESCDLSQLPQLACQTDSPSVRAAIYERLLNAGSEPALRGYLSLVRSETLGAESLAVADAVSGKLLDRLLALLKDEDEGVRLAAAMVLGHANGPEVAAALIEFVTEEPPNPTEAPSPTEAWMAILACRGRQVEEFIDYVMCQPKLLGQFNRARVRLSRMTL